MRADHIRKPLFIAQGANDCVNGNPVPHNNILAAAVLGYLRSP
jgi:hypothetical protein